MAELIVRIAAEIDEDSFKAAEKRIHELNPEQRGIMAFMRNLFRPRDDKLEERVEALGEIVRDILSRESECNRRVSELENEIERR